MSDSELRQVVEAAMEELSVPGVALGIIHEGKEQTAGFGVTNVIVAVAVGFVAPFARVTRGDVLAVKEEPYVEAAMKNTGT